MYKDFIEETLLRMCTTPRTFEYVSRNLYGLDPIVANEYLIDLEKRGFIKKVNDLWVRKGSAPTKQSISKLSESQHNQYLKKHIPYFDLFKKPHPLDFEWRNSSETLDHLCEILNDENSEQDKVLLLGMPSLFASSYIKNLPFNITLVDKNRPLLTAIKNLIAKSKNHSIVNADVFAINPEKLGRFNSVFMDPPWYPEHFVQFIWLASQCLNTGGLLAISIPPINTRPGIDKERMDWFLYCQQQGLCLESVIPQKLEYVMPFFEFNAFRASGLKNIFPFWRKGDLALFRKIEDKHTKRPEGTSRVNEWVEREIDSVRIRIKKEPKQKSPKIALSIGHIIPGDILASVSSRDPKRNGVNVWTSGNRVFKITNPETFIELMDIYKKSETHLTKEAKVVSDFLNVVIDFETKEYNNYLDWLYYEMEKRTD